MQNNIKEVIKNLEHRIKNIQEEVEPCDDYDMLYYCVEAYETAINQIKEIVK